ncbi:hypothetical protein EPN96_12705 [bacterium]|nr:MAG: hypothetical protein EPN96_12705 [bacterium]
MKTKHLLSAAVVLSLVTIACTAGFSETKAAEPAVKAASEAASYTDCTVSDVFTKTAALKGKNIAITGKVVKFSGGIMRTNWFHIKDGTGSAGTDDLVVTSNDVAKVGDQVVVKGELSTDVDFGAGYKYAVIIKDGKVTAK